MEIKQKLRLSQQPYAICFFTEGMFGRVYDMSLYLATIYLPLEIKISLVHYQSLSNQAVLKGGVPLNWLLKHHGDKLIKYNWGYKLKGEWQIQLAAYQNWQIETQKKLNENTQAISKPIGLVTRCSKRVDAQRATTRITDTTFC